EIDSIGQGSFAHPHRGIATLSYIIKGTVEHYDSAGNHGIVHHGGMQWMKAGNGIVHDEIIHVKKNSAITEQLGMQFWINLPAKNKTDKPEYMVIQSADIPEIVLPKNKGKIKIIVGEFEKFKSKIPTDSKLFLYHLELNGGQSHSISIDKGDESAIALIRGKAVINGTEVAQSDFLVFDKEGDAIEIANKSNEMIDIMIFGGEPYTETIAFGGPYVMNSQAEIAQANTDFYAGKYGKIEYQKK
ncbi:MAG: pirin family protein, partial [Flavobacteriaceae bacterium]|nr:pirin family protein [Flavobacteriaceae bacterium]